MSPIFIKACEVMMNALYQKGDFIPDPDTHKDRWQVLDIQQGGMR